MEENNKDKQPTREEFEKMLKEQMTLQFQRGMYQSLYAVTGMITDMIEKFRQKPRKRLADYQKVLDDINRLCTLKLNNPDHKEEKENTNE